jgi:hypothetical protein
MSNVISLDDYREIHDVVKNRLGADYVVIGGILKDGNFLTYIPTEITDIELVYLIQTLNDRRKERLS